MITILVSDVGCHDYNIGSIYIFDFDSIMFNRHLYNILMYVYIVIFLMQFSVFILLISIVNKPFMNE